MASNEHSEHSAVLASPKQPHKSNMNHRQRMDQLYSLPAPLRTFPLPTFIPHNPLSLLYLAYVWISQTLNAPSSNPSPLHQGWWSPETRSIHITDDRSVLALWEQGFYGKGTLSRSEPNWVDREKKRLGAEKGATQSTAEENTLQRRRIRQETKWERARKERNVIDQTRLSEAALEAASFSAAAATMPENVPEICTYSDSSLPASDLEDIAVLVSKASQNPPVGPLELLALPNSLIDLATSLCSGMGLDLSVLPTRNSKSSVCPAPVGPIELLSLPNSAGELLAAQTQMTGHDKSFRAATSSIGLLLGLEVKIVHGTLHITDAEAKVDNAQAKDMQELEYEISNRSVSTVETVQGSSPPETAASMYEHPATPMIKHQKSVRFSPTIEKTTFLPSEPASLGLATSTKAEEEPLAIVNREHFQLTAQESFFLTFALGVLEVLDLVTKNAIPIKELFEIFRRHSSFPPMSTASTSPDDEFMTNYVVYHHFRSLGWCVRGGAKFSCDYMLYQRGPPFTHAEFALLIIPSYTDAYWSKDALLQNYVNRKQARSWTWFHCLNRVITMAKKTLVLVYVDIPKPLSVTEENSMGLDKIFGRYKVREFTVKRWSRDRER